VAAAARTAPPGEETLRGFAPDSTLAQRSLEQRIRANLSAARIEAHLRWLTRRPHPAGSEGARLTAAYLHRALESYGFETETVRYDAYLPAPVSVSLELLEPVRAELRTTEERIEADPFTHAADRHPGWAGYSPSGEARGQVVYAHFGSEAALRSLEAGGVDLEGKVLLMRHFGVDSGRKIANAERFGAAAVVLYADPAEDGYRFGDVYPKGKWRPGGSIMRRSLVFLPFRCFPSPTTRPCASSVCWRGRSPPPSGRARFPSPTTSGLARRAFASGPRWTTATGRCGTWWAVSTGPGTPTSGS
jgi:N-acetylated-alpha-linked acidic dipeptidase